ncbi:MAG: protein-methionine-sulfoxide reductase catalytic subunit MsrP [Ancalomicrobiaceae bacterium]|nr:protein-methionine-sulfoxide reductase catalytic subunit MsrP [Ancalomicrobiaceae bacterium]
MSVFRRRGWEIPERRATAESVFFRRRALLAGLGAGVVGAAAYYAFGDGMSPAAAQAQDQAPDAVLAGLLPAKRNETFKLDRGLTPEKINGNYNNFYEFGTSKYVASAAQGLKTRPWTVKIDGLVNNPAELDFDDLVKKFALEERLYRHRCVEAWSMTIPWTGFALADLVKFADPKAEATYVRFETGVPKAEAPGMRVSWYPWPYTEGLTIAEAKNELAFLAVGTYGKIMPNQHGAPIRLAVPWKYGFKSIKSISRISFVDKRPDTFWEALQSSEYGFWANVNPEVPHPRWSQAYERVLDTGAQVPTQIYNGYGDYVAGLYKDIKGEALFM